MKSTRKSLKITPLRLFQTCAHVYMDTNTNEMFAIPPANITDAPIQWGPGKPVRYFSSIFVYSYQLDFVTLFFISFLLLFSCMCFCRIAESVLYANRIICANLADGFGHCEQLLVVCVGDYRFNPIPNRRLLLFGRNFVWMGVL